VCTAGADRVSMSEPIQRQRRDISYKVVRLRQLLAHLHPDSRINVDEAGLRFYSGESQHCTLMQEPGPGSRKLKPNGTLLARYA
jgi:hypothetical protein